MTKSVVNLDYENIVNVTSLVSKDVQMKMTELPLWRPQVTLTITPGVGQDRGKTGPPAQCCGRVRFCRVVSFSSKTVTVRITAQR